MAIPIQAQSEVEVQENDFSVPVRANINNKTEGADTYLWTFEGGAPSSSTDENPGTVLYTVPGNYTIALEASNRDGTNEVSHFQIKIDEEKWTKDTFF